MLRPRKPNHRDHRADVALASPDLTERHDRLSCPGRRYLILKDSITLLCRIGAITGKPEPIDEERVRITLICATLPMAGLFLMILAAVAFMQDKKMFGSAPKDIQVVIQSKE